MAWAFPTLYYAHVLGNLVATTEVSGFEIGKVLDRMEGTNYKAANTTTPMYFYPSTGPGGGSSLTADYLFIAGHNLGTIGATITLQKSSTGAWAGEEVNVTSKTPTDDLPIANEFASTSEDYWRAAITGTLSAAPYIAVCTWGEKTETANCKGRFSPYGESEKVNQNISATGILLGDHENYIDREIVLSWNNIPTDGTLDAKLKAHKNDVGRLSFGLAWEKTNHSSEIWLVRRKVNGYKETFSPQYGGLYKNISISFQGRME